jgi:esterase/lipase
MERDMTSQIIIDGENQAVRAFLLLYGIGGNQKTVPQMRDHLKRCGFDGYWPDWAAADASGLTKSGAQSWLRYLFDLEKS